MAAPRSSGSVELPLRVPTARPITLGGGITLSIIRIRAALRRIPTGDVGLSMAEIIVALMVFAILATGVAYGLTNTLIMTQNSRARAAAVALASEDLDAMRLRALNTKDGILQITSTPTGSPLTKVVGGTTYSIDRDVNWVDTTGGLGACGTGNGTLAYKSVTNTISWKLTSGGTTQSVKMSTSVAPISNLNTDTTGTIIVQAILANGAPAEGLGIAMVPLVGGAALATAPQNTDSDGCSFGLKVQPGTYQVSATSNGGGIDSRQSDPSVNKNVVVKAGQNTVVNVSYDKASVFPIEYPEGAAVATNMSLTLINPAVTTQIPNAPSSISAFPWPDGYRIVAGTFNAPVGGGSTACVDTDPAKWTTVRSDGAVASAGDASATPPGTTAPPTAVGAGVLTVSGLNPGTWVTAATSSSPGDGDPGCTAAQTLTFPQATGASQVIALPYGTWNLYAGNSRGSLTTNLLTISGVSVLGGLLNGGGPKSVTVDPRRVP